ncbi:hypothetical protein [Streptomyces sp. NPDC056105]|uniref:hypothetical protein n=1 Tax=Streptomyces sp. NPDC056105 TaxID=3345714 RepID=UPI0035D88854
MPAGTTSSARRARAAATALAAAADELGFRVELLGTPAEEEGGGKVLIRERGADMGDITHAMPLSHPAIGVPGAQGMPHTRRFAEEVSGAAGDEAVLGSVLAMAWTGLDPAADPRWRTRRAASRHG